MDWISCLTFWLNFCVFVSGEDVDASIKLRRMEKVLEKLQTTYEAEKISFHDRIASLQNTVNVLEVKLAETTRHAQSLEARLSKSEDQCKKPVKQDNNPDDTLRIKQKNMMDGVFTKGNNFSNSHANRQNKTSLRRHIQRGTPEISQTQPIAFSVRHDGPVVGPLNGHSTLKIAGPVKLNDGDGYNEASGTFICPQSGMYLFAWNIASPPNHYANIEFLVNGAMRQSTYANENPYVVSAAGFDVVRLNKGDMVWLQTAGKNAHYIYGWETMFAGVLLKQ